MRFSAEKLKSTFLELGLCPSCRLYFEPDVSQPVAVAADVVAVDEPSTPPSVENLVNENNLQEPLEAAQRPCLGSRLLQGI